MHFSVLDASGASLSNAHQGEYPPNRKTSLPLERVSFNTAAKKKKIFFALLHLLFYSVAVWYFIL